MKLFKQILSNPSLFYFYLLRFVPIIFSINIIYLFKGVILASKYKLTKNISFKYFMFWLYIWTNALSSKYRNLTEDDFDIESVPNGFDINNIIPVGYREMADEKIPENKINAQHKATVAALKKIILLRTT